MPVNVLGTNLNMAPTVKVSLDDIMVMALLVNVPILIPIVVRLIVRSGLSHATEITTIITITPVPIRLRLATPVALEVMAADQVLHQAALVAAM